MNATNDSQVAQTWEHHRNHLFNAEMQFRMVAAVRIAVVNKRQPLDFPDTWQDRFFTVTYDELALRQDQAEYAVFLLEHSATYTMAVTIKDAIEALVPELPNALRKKKRTESTREIVEQRIAKSQTRPWKISDTQVASVYLVARLIRNAFAHSPFNPTWSISNDLANEMIEVTNVLKLCTSGLDGKPISVDDYGGILRIYRLCRVTRFDILADTYTVRKDVPAPQRRILQLGDALLEEIDSIPEGYREVEVTGESLDLGKGYVLKKSESP